MIKYLLVGATALALAAPAAATNDNSGYVGLEAGATWPKSQSIFGNVVFTNPAVPAIVGTNVGSVKYKTGYDIDLIGGYDFGMFRVEGELGYKHAKTKDFNFNSAFINAFNAGAGTTFTTGTSFNLNDHASVFSAMLNGLVDFGGNGSFGGYAGAGVGYANVKQFGGSSGKFAWQLIAGVYMPVSSSLDIGLKYRYFRAGRTNGHDEFVFPAGNGCAAGATCSGGTAFFDTDSRYSSHSLLASLVYNFGAVPAPPPPPPPPAPTERGERGR